MTHKNVKSGVHCVMTALLQLIHNQKLTSTDILRYKISTMFHKKNFHRNSHFLPDGDEVVRPMNLKQGEVKFDAEARGHGDQPGAVS